MIKILYEDNHLLVVLKPANMPVQADSSGDLDLLTDLKLYIKKKYSKPGNVYLGLVHRLDRPVGGVMVFAKTSKAASRLSSQIRNNMMHKKYFAVVYNDILDSGTFEDYLLKDESTNTVRVDKNGKKSVLNYKLIDSKNNLNLVDIDLITGRSHQIRVQFSSRGNPLYGDMKYNKFAKKGQQIALFAYGLSFEHPVSHENMNFEYKMLDFYPWNEFKGDIYEKY